MTHRTSANGRRRVAIGITVALGLGGATVAADDEPPDMAFLEYLGTWETDEDWAMFVERAGDDDAESDAGEESVAAKDESTEQDDES